MLASDGGSAEVIRAVIIVTSTTGISGDGLIRAMRPGGDAPLEAKSALHLSDHAAVALQRKAVLVFHMAWRMTANFLATATRAFLNPTFLASLSPHALSVEKPMFLVSKVVAGPARRSWPCTIRQWPRVHRQGRAGLDNRCRRQDRLHRARQSMGEWLLRELQLEAS